MPDLDYTVKVSAHYTPADLNDAFLQVLTAWGKDDAGLTPSELAPLDQFHIGGQAATLALAEIAGVDVTTRVLDVGGGFGGPARTLAATYGCSVTVLDLTAVYCEVGEMLTARTGLTDRVTFRQGNALDVPFADGEFDLVWTQHSSMNIADKRRFFAETYRVLRPGGRFALYDIMAGTEQPLRYPVPWAEDASLSFLLPPEDAHDLVTEVGYRTLRWEDVTEATLAALPRRSASTDDPPGLHLVLGEDFRERARNMVRNLAERRTSLIRAVLERE
jgi:MPBQ/MSBQ methyltransferase